MSFKNNVAGTLDIFNIPANFFISQSKNYFYIDDKDNTVELSIETFEDRMIILQFVRDGGEVFYNFKSDDQKINDRFEKLECKIVELLNV